MVADLIGALTCAAAGAAAPAHVETVVTDTPIEASPNEVWAAIRDPYAVATRLVPGMVVKVGREPGDVRRVTFANGFVVTERIIKIDDKARCLAYSAFGGKSTYHLATMQVVANGRGKSRVVWRTDFLPAELRPFIEQNMRAGSEIMKRHLESVHRPR